MSEQEEQIPKPNMEIPERPKTGDIIIKGNVPKMENPPPPPPTPNLES